MKKVRVLVADDNTLLRESLCRLLENEEDFECVGVASDGEKAVELVKELAPDVALIDISMPQMDGIEAARHIKTECPDVAILMLTIYRYDHYVIGSLEAGADGYILKDVHPDELINAIRTAHAGSGVFNLKAVLRRLASASKRGDEVGIHRLGGRELEVLKSVARGHTNRSIATKLVISEHTVASRLINIFSKLGVTSRTEAVLRALKQGLLSINDIG